MWFLVEVDLAEDGSLHDWRVIVIRMKGRRAVVGNLIAFGVEESFNEAKRKSLHALKEAWNQTRMPGRRMARKRRKLR